MWVSQKILDNLEVCRSEVARSVLDSRPRPLLPSPAEASTYYLPEIERDHGIGWGVLSRSHAVHSPERVRKKRRRRYRPQATKEGSDHEPSHTYQLDGAIGALRRLHSTPRCTNAPNLD
ncbi:unnamed protein product [Leptosia nina]|uniref:Uncharacterized protein n=1 Tax=Leptosia nina TaxID=320188 RepID=A0AAV1JVZ7_9NEOP